MMISALKKNLYGIAKNRVIIAFVILITTLLFTSACGLMVVSNAPKANDDLQTESKTRPTTALKTSVPMVSVENSPTPTILVIQTKKSIFTPTPFSTATKLPATPIESTSVIPATIEPSPVLPQNEAELPPLPTPAGVYSWTLKVPILMYHYISIPPEDADKYRQDLSVSPEDFRAQMGYLADNGYQTIDFYDLSRAITAKQDLPEKPVIITMDDGYRDNYENAFPILQEFGLNATFFVVTEFIDKNQEDYMNWEMVEEMARAGMRIEPHSKTHADLSGQEKDYVIYEILGSQETIAAHIGYKPLYFCYPGGRYDQTTLEVIEELGFWGAVTTAGGEWHGFNNRYEWERLRMRNSTTLADFAFVVDPRGTVSGKY